MGKGKIFFLIIFIIVTVNALYMMNRQMEFSNQKAGFYDKMEFGLDENGNPLPTPAPQEETSKEAENGQKISNFFDNFVTAIQNGWKNFLDQFKPTVLVYLKNGNVLKGEAVRQTDLEVILIQDGSEISFLQEEVSRVDEKGKKKGRRVTLYLKDNSVITGDLLRETDSEYFLLWQGGEVGFKKSEVAEMKKGDKVKAKEGVVIAKKEQKITEENAWKSEGDIAIHLKNQSILGGNVTAVTDTLVTVEQGLEGGGAVEQDVPRDGIDYLLFKSLIDNDESKKIEAQLRKKFPEMKAYTEGNFTIFTDSYITWVRQYRTTLKFTYTELYLNLFPLFKDRKPEVQNFIVIFDDLYDYVDYAATDGIPGLFVAGYFLPDERVLYLPNLLGDSISDFIKSIFVDQIGAQIDRSADSMINRAGSQYELAIEGMAEDVKKRFWEYHDLVTAELKNETFRTLRHEFTHSILSNWGIQGIISSKPQTDQNKLTEEKSQFMKTDDPVKKQEVLEKLMHLRKDNETFEMEAANSWLVEGLATYCETIPFGKENEFWLYTVQKMVRENKLMPFEQLSVYKMGSFPGVYPDAMIEAYSQSWAFVTFLMERYPNQFLQYLEKMSRGGAQGHEDYQWLVQILGKDLRVIEEEFLAFLKEYPELEDPFFKRFDQVRKIFTAF